MAGRTTTDDTTEAIGEGRENIFSTSDTMRTGGNSSIYNTATRLFRRWLRRISYFHMGRAYIL
jgi:hypothetical protein